MPEYASLCSLVAASYLLGAVPFGLLIARVRGIDIRKVGSGNIGATNVFRSVGKTWGILTFVCDALKGFIPAYAGYRLTAGGAMLTLWECLPGGSSAAGASLKLTPEIVSLLCGSAAIVGHNWPVYLRFKGGKGVATSAGVMLGVAPLAVAAGFGTWVIVFLATRYVSVASIVAAAVVGGASWRLYADNSRVLPAVLTVLAVLSIWRHKPNIQRLINGTENRFTFGRKKN